MPQPIRRWVADLLGSRISESHEQVGGMSPGCATRLVSDDGQRIFVKVVGTPLNPLTWRAHTVVDVNLPTMQAFRLQESGRMLSAAGRRLGVA